MNPLRATHHRAHGAAAVFLLVAALLAVRPQVQPAHAATPTGGPYVGYALDRNLQSVQVFNAASGVSTTTIAMPSSPVALAITPDAQLVLVVLDGNSQFPTAGPPPVPQVVAISTKTNTIVKASAAINTSPTSIAITPDGSTAFVTHNPNFFNYDNTIVTQLKIPTLERGPDITLATFTPNSFPPGMPDDAISPDGAKLYILTSLGKLESHALPSGTPLTTFPVPTGGTSMLISPDGGTAFIANGCSDCSSGFITTVPLNLASGSPEGQINLPANPTSMVIATTAEGTSTLYVSLTNLSILPISLNGLKPQPPISTNSIDAQPLGLSATPDASRLEASVSRAGGRVVSIDTSSNTIKPCPVANDFNSCPAGDSSLAVTPDQRPVASFIVSPPAANVGTPISFDASASTVTYGSVTIFAWDFGDGSKQTTGGPTTSHSYTVGGTYTVTLVETDAAGTSVGTSPPSTVFTGHTMTRTGGPPAQTTRQITITTPGASPTPTPTPTTPAGTPVLALNPVVGPPGIVVAVAGSGFAPNATVVLVWQPGIGSTTVKADGSGSFHTFALVFSHDRIGKRQMAAQGTAATAQFLVVPPSVSPGGHDAEVVFRR